MLYANNAKHCVSNAMFYVSNTVLYGCVEWFYDYVEAPSTSLRLFFSKKLLYFKDYLLKPPIVTSPLREIIICVEKR